LKPDASGKTITVPMSNAKPSTHANAPAKNGGTQSLSHATATPTAKKSAPRPA
jgi:hypothetical protein